MFLGSAVGQPIRLLLLLRRKQHKEADCLPSVFQILEKLCTC
jgi:hypothetical protein